jgi:cell division protein ZapD
LAIVILYEHPLNERIRTYLRLELLLRRVHVLASRDSSLDHHFCLVSLFETLEVASRPELKSDLLKDLEKQKQQLSSYRGNPAISESALEHALGSVQSCFDDIHGLQGKFGQTIALHEMLGSIRSRVSIPGGTCGFDLPAYHSWLARPAHQRQTELTVWIDSLKPLSQAVDLLLNMLRSTESRQLNVAIGGQFQQTISQQRTYQLLRLRIDPETGAVPEISSNRLLMVIRMQKLMPDGRLQTCTDDVQFDLSLCA